MPEKNSEIIAAIDVGTNSFHMVVASVSAHGVLNILSKDKETVRLGSSAGDIKKLSETAMIRGAKALKRFAIEAKHHGARVRAIATSAVREASNREQFVELVLKESGVNLEVVSGVEEGRLIYAGAVNSVPIHEERALIIDIGGGSTETVVGYKGEALFVSSVKLGHLRLTKRFFANGVARKRDVALCREAIKGDWFPTFQALNDLKPNIAVGTSGTIHSIATACLALQGKRLPETLNGSVFSGQDLLSTVEAILSVKKPEDRVAIPGIDSKRADVIVAGALILEQAIVGLDIDEIVISSYALREGVVFDTVEHDRLLKESNHLSRLRLRSVDHLCDLYDVNRAHADHVRDIALNIFDSMLPLHNLGSDHREILEVAALLHDVGYHISADQHHKHSDYLIRNSPLPGFTNNETEIIATVARYHRKSHPKKKHANYSLLNADEQRVVRVLASILRIAEGLDRRQQQFVGNVAVEIGENEIRIIVDSPRHDPDIELWGAERRKALMEETFDMAVSLVHRAI